MTKCPRCKEQITELRVAHTEWLRVHVMADIPEAEKKEFYRKHDWPTVDGKALGFLATQEPHQYEFYCPKCGACLFTNRAEALKFLLGIAEELRLVPRS